MINSDRLADYEPQIKGGVLIFLCPTCEEHQIRVYLCPKRDHNDRCWTATGELPNLTLAPSINIEGHWHKNITAGKFV